MCSNTGRRILTQSFKQFSFSLQIGGDMFLTAAHCLENWAGEIQEPSELSVYLGVHNRKDLENAK